MSAARFLVVARAFMLAVAACYLGSHVTPDRRFAPMAHRTGDDALALLGAVDGDAHGARLRARLTAMSISSHSFVHTLWTIT